MRTSHTIIYALALLGIFFLACSAPNTQQTKAPMETDIDQLLTEMTLEEKIGMIHASSAFTSGGVERLGIPELTMSDGPHGVRHEHGRDWVKDEGVRDSSTYLPTGIGLAATWNKDLGYAFGKVLGSEANYRGKDVILGPGFNMLRTPVAGRNFEYLSEDPYLNAQMVVGYIRGVQEQGVAACAKHYIANTLEYERQKVNVEMNDRAFRELYLPPYIAAVKEADVLTIMAAYNKFRGTYCAHSQYLLDQVLKEEIGFQGAVISDWNAVKNTLEAANAGVDIEMGTDLSQGDNRDYDKFWLADPLIPLVKDGTVKEAVIDAKVRRILWVMERIHKFGERPPGAYNIVEHQQVARQVADECLVLLKNEDLLPLDRRQMKNVAVVGANANWRHAGAGGKFSGQGVLRSDSAGRIAQHTGRRSKPHLLRGI